jgi:hypothetical protein
VPDFFSGLGVSAAGAETPATAATAAPKNTRTTDRRSIMRMPR